MPQSWQPSALPQPVSLGVPSVSPRPSPPRPRAASPARSSRANASLWIYDQANRRVCGGGTATPRQPYSPNPGSPPKPLTFAFAEGWAAIPFSVAINKGMYKIADEIGIKIIYCDQEFKAEKAVTCAEQLSQQKPDSAIVSNWQAGAAESIMKIYDAAKIPVVNIDVWHPNGIFFGADNYVSGEIGGKAAGEYAKSLGRCADVTIFLAASTRAKAMPPPSGWPGSRTACRRSAGRSPRTGSRSEIIDAGTTEQALTKTTDWLTANPNAGYVLATSIDDARSAGVSKALAQSVARRRRRRPRLRRHRRRGDQGRRPPSRPTSSAASPTSRRSTRTTYVDRPRRPGRDAGARTRSISSTSSSTRRRSRSVYP